MKELIGKEILGREWKVWKHVPSGVWECDWECRYKQGNIPPETGEKYHSVQKYLSFKRESLDKINTLTWKVISDRCTNLRLRIFPVPSKLYYIGQCQWYFLQDTIHVDYGSWIGFISKEI